MENEKNKRRRNKKPRQEWNPHWLLKLLYTAGSVAMSLLRIAVGAAAGLVRFLNENGGSPEEVLENVSKLNPDDQLYEMIMNYYKMITENVSVHELLKAADLKKQFSLHDVI